MKSYEALADYYDDLIIDHEEIKKWCVFTEKHSTGKNLLELACGSGAITELLVNAGFTVTGSDISLPMLEKAREKLPQVEFLAQDMRSFTFDKEFDTVVCYNDSVNYITETEDLKKCFACVNKVLKKGGVFLFDVHTMERLEQFEEEYLEEGMIQSTPYQWSIESEDERLFHHLAFWTEKGFLEEEHIQRVYPKEELKQLLNEAGFTVQVFTDFVEDENTLGEKWYFIARKD